MPKGPRFVQANAERHAARVNSHKWSTQCSEVDVEKLRQEASIEHLKANGLTYEERQTLREKVSLAAKARAKRVAAIERRLAS